MTAGRHDSYASLRVPNYRWFVLSLLAMTVASQIQAVVVAWQIYAITKDPLSLGLIGLAVGGTFLALWLIPPKNNAPTSASIVVGPGSLGLAGTF